MSTRHLLKYLLALCVAAVEPMAFGQTSATASGSSATAAEAAAQQTADEEASAVKAGTKIDAELASSIDAKTAKPGDRVEARVLKNVKQKGRVVVHKGDRLLGTVTQAQADATGKAGSQMSVAFDRLAGANGETQLNTVLTSVFSSSSALENQPVADTDPMLQPMAGASGGGMAQGSAGGGGMLGGVGSTVGSTVGGAVGAAGSATGSAVGSVASTADSVGSTVGRTGGTLGAATGANAGAGSSMGLATPARAIHIQSNTDAQGQSATTSTLSTRHGDLRLDSGTRMQFKVASNTSASAQQNQ